MTRTTRFKMLRSFLAIMLAFALATSISPIAHSAYADGDEAMDGVDVVSAETAGEASEPTVDDLDVTDILGTDPNEGQTAPETSSNPASDMNSDDEEDAEEDEDWLVVETAARAAVSFDGKNSATVTSGSISVSLKEKKTYTLTIDGNVVIESSIVVPAGTTLNLKGSGVLDGANKGSVVIVKGDGAKLVLSELTISGGRGSILESNNIFAPPGTTNWYKTAVGGAIQVTEGGSLHMKSGTLQDNTAQAGGAIFINRDCNFIMDGGTIQKNKAAVRTFNVGEGHSDSTDGKAAHEGGGIYTAGPDGKINGGDILNNHTYTKSDWGGGGIFVENKGSLDIAASHVTGNSAKGLGGGISGCPHAHIGLGEMDSGYAVYGNSASGTNWPTNTYLDKNNGIGDYIAKGNPNFTADKAWDYYCTRDSAIYGPTYGDNESKVAWIGYEATSTTSGKDVKINRGEWWPATKASLGLTAIAPSDGAIKDIVSKRKVYINGNTSSTHGGGVGCNGVVTFGGFNQTNEQKFNSWIVEFNKKLIDLNGTDVLAQSGETFDFALYDAPRDNANKIAVATNAKDGIIQFLVNHASYRGSTAGTAYTLYAKELTVSSDGLTCDAKWHPVTVTVKQESSSSTVGTHTITTTKCYVDGAPTYGIKDGEGKTFTNTLKGTGSIELEGTKYYAGSDADKRFSFTLQEVKAPADVNHVDLNALERVDDPITASNGAFGAEQKAPIKFDKIMYGATGEHWYLIQEDNGHDPKVYAVKVVVTIAENGRELDARVTEVHYADDMDSSRLLILDLEEAGSVSDAIEFRNTDERFAFMSLRSYAVNAATNQPVDQMCLVDPKIIKKLDGGALKVSVRDDENVGADGTARVIEAGEFKFHLVEVATPTGADVEPDWADTSGEVISTAYNDAYGMVDFDAANNKAPDGYDPCCLVFTSPGTYYYRVVEDKVYNTNPSIQYSDQIITFTTVIREENGQLVEERSYYGYAAENESGVLVNHEYMSTDDDPTFVANDPSWHPTMTNHLRGMDLQVRKTSADNREEGLEGAVYALYAVTNGVSKDAPVEDGMINQADIKIKTATSDADGWIVFEDVNLTQNQYYYFMEEAAPEGHTVSEFRSEYFYLVADNSPNGFTMFYTDKIGDTGYSDADLETTPATYSIMTLDEERVEPVTSADGRLLFTFAGRDNGVYDETTYVEFAKLDTRTHEWVEGARLSVIDEATGEVMRSWVSGTNTETVRKTLNVGTVYILREESAPSGYGIADDVRFRIGEYGAVEILSGTSNGNAEIQGSTITLYDTMLDAELVERQIRERTNALGGLGQTGDSAPYGAILLLAAASFALLATAGFKMRARKMAQAKHSPTECSE